MTMDWVVDVTESFSFRPWRLLTIFYMLPGVFGTFLLLKLPESPKILISMGKVKDAYGVVNWMALQNTGKQLKELNVEELKFEEFPESKNLLCLSNSP